MTCSERERDLALYAGGDLRAPQLEQHLEQCARCREYLAAMSAVLADLGHEAIPATPPIVTAVVRRIRVRRYGWAALTAMTAAASVAVAVLASALVRPVPTISFAARTPAAPQPVVATREPVVAVPKPLRVRHRRTVGRPAEPIVVKLVTDDPNVVIYWITD
ncbi:MAG TPA: hypothetical protein VFL57_05205 [Bryobacteraceae bacterium]|nr:hypothetical protein [Bryobacteraceae bacterium]